MATFCDDAFGKMDANYVEDRLTEFDCELISDEADSALNKMNALSTVYSIRNEDLIDGLVAFLKNTKRNIVTPSLLDEYENQIIAKKKNQTSAKIHSSSATTFRNERQILKELSLSMFSKTSLEDGNGGEDDGHHLVDSEISAIFDEPKDCKNIQNHLGLIVKSKFTGNSFSQELDEIGQNNAASMMDLPQHKIVSDCRQSSYLYGHSSIIYDIYEIMPWLNDQENDGNLEDGAGNENEDDSLILTGSIYPQEGIHLNFDNATLFTANDSYLLDFDKIERISLFPGMNLSVKCQLDGNGICQVQRVMERPQLPMAELNHLSPYSRLKICIASGPFSANNVDWEKFQNLLNSAKNVGANALILIGPFVPTNIDDQSGENAENIFQTFYNNLFNSLKGAKIHVYLIPNCQSDLMAMPYFPTPPICLNSQENSHKNDFITFLPDPAQFDFEGVRIAVSSSEILTHLCKREIYKSTNMENEDRMHRLISNLFSNHSLYPLFPSDPNLSFSLQNSHSKLRLDVRPHVLILPSILQPLTKEVDGSLFINPGRFSRGKGTGTFALLEIDLHSALSLSAATAGNNGTSISQFSEVSLLVS